MENVGTTAYEVNTESTVTKVARLAINRAAAEVTRLVTRNVAIVPVKKKKPSKSLGCCHLLAGSTGLEPAASGVTGRRSNQLNYDPDGTDAANFLLLSGGRYRIRTCGSRRVRPVLYH